MEISEDHECEKLIIPFRKKEVEFLTRFFHNKLSSPQRSLFIYGHRATGKTFVLLQTIQYLSLSHVWINCNEYYTSQLIFSKIVNQLSKNDSDYKKVTNSLDFIVFLKKNLKAVKETLYLVFDCAEVLRNEDNLMILLMKLKSITKVNICTIFLSETFFDDIIICNYSALHFPDYSKSDMCEILCLDCPQDCNEDFYSRYINVIMRTFYPITRNLSELKYLAENNFEKYCKPIEEDPEYEISSLRLWKNIEPTLKEAIRCVYLREVSGSKWKTFCNSDANTKLPTDSIGSHVTRELPCFSKFLLLSAYFASYNPPKSDFKHFVKNQGKQKKKRITKRGEKNRHLLGPKPFTLDRLLSIFFSIVGERVLPSALIFSQISSLVHMRLISKVSADEQLDCPKYKCLAERELVCRIGKTVGVDVMGYLDDYL